MDATTYLHSLGIEPQPPNSPSVGKLALAADFHIDKSRGVVVRPKRGGISGRYLDLLAAEGIDYVLVDGKVPVAVYGRVALGEGLEPLRSLPVKLPSRFPGVAMLRILADLLLGATRKSDNALEIGSGIIAAKQADEQQSEAKLFTVATAADRDGSSARRIGDAVGLVLPDAGPAAAAMATTMALLAGYRLTPKSPGEAAALIEFVAQLASPKAWGLPCAAAFAFNGPWTKGRHTLVVSNSPGVQLLPLRVANEGAALLPLAAAVNNPLFSSLFPNTTFVDADFLHWSTESKPDCLVLVPPFGRTVTDPELLRGSELSSRRSRKASSRLPAETLYIEHAVSLAAAGALLVAVVPEGLLSSAGHADFRAWLLEQVQLLAVLSLPANACFIGSGIRCSVLYLKKVDPVPSDYSITMIEADEEDLHDDAEQSRLATAITETLVEGAP